MPNLVRYSCRTKFGTIRRAIFSVKIEGESMWPVLIPGRQYLATNMLPIRRGDWAVFKNPQNTQEIFVKRVIEISNSEYHMESLVSWGSSSRNFGPVEKEFVLGKILFINE
ncbi:MAG: S26 family signal peptidase [Candidatus Sungbacteria bacterium]|nr:S26 family signal peptidase [Candidatus Sungbacteria bacterium]